MQFFKKRINLSRSEEINKVKVGINELENKSHKTNKPNQKNYLNKHTHKKEAAREK